MAMDNEQFRKLVAMMESRNGKDFRHPLITQGVNKGTHAAGTYGLTKGLVGDLAKQHQQFAALKDLPWEQQKAFIESHPQDEAALYDTALAPLKTRYNGDPEMMRYAWSHGTSLPASAITPEKLAMDPDSQRFRSLMQKLNGGPIQKPLMAQALPKPVSVLAQNEAPIHPLDTTSPTIQDIINDPSNPFTKEFEDKDTDTEEASLSTPDEDETMKRNRYAKLI